MEKKWRIEEEQEEEEKGGNHWWKGEREGKVDGRG